VVDDKSVEPIHRYTPTTACGRALVSSAGADIVAIASALAGSQCHPAPAAGAAGEAGQQRRTAHNPGRCLPGVSLSQSGTDLRVGGLVDDGGNLGG
jgi:hypothetical protein